MGGLWRRRTDIALWSAFGIEAVGLATGFALAEPTSLRPDYSGSLLVPVVLLIAGVGSFVTFVLALIRRRFGAAWWSAASGAAPLAVLVMLLESGTGTWFIVCATAALAAFAGALASLLRGSRPAPQDDGDAGDAGDAAGGGTGKAAAAVAAVALVASVSMGGGMEDVDYSGTWTSDRRDLTLTLTDKPLGGGHYTLRWGGCSEEDSWVLDYPQMTTSVRVRLLRDATTKCLPGDRTPLLHVAGGTVAAPILNFRGPDGTRWTLTRD
ncbi:hypothetical protein ACH4XT_02545 [Streptomyces avidinii]|uniref:hypothetical protein n=1 Tax=Streptomyces avidinii TaxID=1895 RepID=UPI0037BC1183